MPERGGYKVLCVSALHPKASDDVVRDTLYREYKKYGDISVRVMHEPDERVAYVYFRSFEDAKDAKHSKSRIILFDKATMVEAVYESATREEYESRSGGGRPRSVSPPPRYDGGGGYGRPRSPDRYRDDYHRDDHWDAPPRGHPPPSRRGGGGGYRGGRGGGRDDYRGGPPRDDFRGPPPRGPPRGPPPGYHDNRYNDYGGASYPPPRRENKKDKFPNYMDHISPEDDPLATRTLFAGNLELNITDEEMKRIFGKYGRLVDIDIKRPPPGTGNAFAFMRFENLDMAAAAKKELSGQYIGKFQCKIGYGKVVQTTKVWIGGLGHWCTQQMLEREFDRFGVMRGVDYEKGDTEATIQYESIDAAQAAVTEMRGFPLGGPDKRIRIDYYDVEDMPVARTGYQGSDYDPNIAKRGRGYYNGPGRGAGGYHHGGGGRGGYHHGGGGRGGGGGHHDDWGKRPGEYLDGPPNRIRKMDSRSPEGRDGIMSAKSITDLSKRIERSWEGGLILKNSLFPTKLLLTEGDHDVVEQLMQDENDKPYLKITQRLRLDQAKLDDVSKRISSSNSHAIFLALTTSSASVPVPAEGEVQSRPLRNLVSYLKQKDAAGVISLQNRETSQTGVLYAFPPCQFSTDLLKRVARNLSDEASKDDHLVVVVVRGT